MKQYQWVFKEIESVPFYLVKNQHQVVYLAAGEDDFSTVQRWVAKQRDGQLIQGNLEDFKDVIQQLHAYLKGKQHVFTFPVAVAGTPFQKQVWQALETIPYGEVYTYKQIAQLIEKPQAVRAVGTAIGANPLVIVIPCHRVIGTNGQLTGFRSGLPLKKKLLQIEQKNKQQAKC